MLMAVLASLLAWLHLPMGFKPQVSGTSLSPQVLDLSIELGTSPKGVAQAFADVGADVSPSLLVLWFRLSGQDRAIKAGSYEITPEMSPRTALNMLTRGEESLRYVTLVEGWTFKQVKQALAKAEFLKSSTQGMSDEQIMAQLGRPNVHPEGRFYPDTYSYGKGSSDIAVMNRALKAMDLQLTKVWTQKPANSPLSSPDELLILASIVEKETGRASDRPLISSVFHNRIKIGMRLQTDPTVIYGMGDVWICGLSPAVSGVEDLNSENQVRVYPNPLVGEQISVESVEPFEWIELLSAENKILLHQVNTNNTLEIQLAIGNITPGIYFLRLGNKHQTVTKKIVVVNN